VQNTKLETIQIETLTQITGGLGGWLGMLTGKSGDESSGLGTALGGGGGGLNGKGGGLAETVGGWARGLFGGRAGGVVEGK
jgi:hypothetical protein